MPLIVALCLPFLLLGQSRCTFCIATATVPRLKKRQERQMSERTKATECLICNAVTSLIGYLAFAALFGLAAVAVAAVMAWPKFALAFVLGAAVGGTTALAIYRVIQQPLDLSRL